MDKLNQYKKELIGKKLINVFHTDQGNGIEHLNGLGNAYYFSTIIEIENNKKYIFGNDWIDKWDNSEKLSAITHNKWGIKKSIKFKNEVITNILFDDCNDIYFLLANKTIFYHNIDYGDKLFFDNYSNITNSIKLFENPLLSNDCNNSGARLEYKKKKINLIDSIQRIFKIR